MPEGEQIEDVLTSIADDAVIVQDMGYTSWPAQNINTIDNWNASTGYKMKVADEASQQLSGYEKANKIINLARDGI